MIETGPQAPDFELPDQDGEPVTLSGLRGRRVVLYFYPKADTPGCTTQACGIRDRGSEYDAAGATVLGVSPDPVKDVKKFHARQSLNFTLLADEDHAVGEQYGVWGEKSMYGKTYMGAAALDVHHRRGRRRAPRHPEGVAEDARRRGARGAAGQHPVAPRRGDRARGEDQRQVAERLREVADLPPRAPTSYSSASRPRSLASPISRSKSVARLVDAAVARERADEPERAGEELPLVARQAVVGLRGRVARDEAVAAQLAPDRVDRPGHALVVAGQEADERDVEHARVQLLRAVVLRERAPLGVVAALAHLGVDLVADARQRSSGASSSNRSASRTARSNTTHAMTFEYV